jgi:hypothetical protein
MKAVVWVAAIVVCALVLAQDRDARIQRVLNLLDSRQTEPAIREIRVLAESAAFSEQEKKQLSEAAARIESNEAAAAAQVLRRLLSSAPLSLKRTYSGPRVEQRGAGGHASSAAPPPPAISVKDDLARIRATGIAFDFENVPVNFRKTYFGGAAKDHILESAGGGVAIFDYDGDGLQDIYVVHGPQITNDRKLVWHRNALYRNLGNWKFEDAAKRAGVDAAAWGSGVCACDYNADGRLDLYVTNFGRNLLYRNNGNGTFTDVAAEAGVQLNGWSTGCSFFDGSGTGRLDLFVAGYVEATLDEVLSTKPSLLYRGGPTVMTGPAGLPPRSDTLLRNNGPGRFTNATSSLKGLVPAYGFGVLTFDADLDGRIDIYVANDSNPNFLFRNLGDGQFREAAMESGVALSADGRAQAGMGVDAGDWNGDGLPDVIVTNFANDTNTLYQNKGSGQFEDVSEKAGLVSRTYKALGWGAAFFDADRDGDLDLFFANGHIFPQIDQYPDLQETFRQRNQLLINDTGGFLDASEAAGKALFTARSHRGLAVGDLDNDGHLDLVVTAMDEAPAVLRNRTRTPHNWIGLDLRCPSSPNRFCLGARVAVKTGELVQIREVRSGGSYLSQNDLRVHFGLGKYTSPVDVDVTAPAGITRQFRGLEPGRYHALAVR